VRARPVGERFKPQRYPNPMRTRKISFSTYEARPAVISQKPPHTEDPIPPVFVGHSWKNEYRPSMARKANKTSGASVATKKAEKVEETLKKMRQRQEEMIQEKQRQAKEKKHEATNKQDTVTTSSMKQGPKKQAIQKSVGWLLCGPDTSLLPFEKEAVQYLYGTIRDTKRLPSAISDCPTFEDTQYYTEDSQYYTEYTDDNTKHTNYTEYTDDNTKHTFGDMTLASSKEPNLIRHGFRAIGELLSGDLVEEPKPPRHRRVVADDPPKHRRVVADVKSVDDDDEEEEEAKNNEEKTEETNSNEEKTEATTNNEKQTEATKNDEVKPRTALPLEEEVPSLRAAPYTTSSTCSREEDDYEGQFLEEFLESEAIASSSGVELSLLRKVTRIEI
jgi:hypothetical protein